jgi:hypothetical protein
MSLIGLIIAVLVVALVVYCVRLLPIEQPFKNIILVLVVLMLILWLLGGWIPSFRIS